MFGVDWVKDTRIQEWKVLEEGGMGEGKREEEEKEKGGCWTRLALRV